MKILYILMLVTLSSCSQKGKEKKEVIVKAEDAIGQKTSSDSNKQEEVKEDDIQYTVEDISGVYELINGKTHIVNSDSHEIYKAAIVIEKLSETDFGFYSAYKRKEISPIGDFGVLRGFKNDFYNLAICDGEDIEGYSKDNFTNGLYLHNKVMVHKKGDSIGIIRYGGNFRNYMLYKKKKNQSDFYTSLVKTLKNTKLDYEKFLKEYKNANNYNTTKLQLKHFFEGGVWKTKHIHTEDYASFEKTHSYQNPDQDGKFTEEDTLFKYQIEGSKFSSVISEMKIKTVPLIDATNFDSFIEEGDYDNVNVQALKLKKIYPNFYKEGHNYKAIANYKLELSEDFYTVVVTVLKGEHEMESVLINYDLNGTIIDSKVISYDEIAEGMFKIESKIEQSKLTITSTVDMEEKNETIEAFRIKTDGKIESVPQKGNLIDTVIQQLNLDKSKVNQDFVSSMVQPDDDNETIVVIPEISEGDENDFILNSHIVLVNNSTGEITHKYFEKNAWQSDAILLSEIAIDTTSYAISKNSKAFGIQVSYHSMSQPNPYSNRTLSLFEKSGDTLKKVLHHYDVMEYGGEVNVNACDAYMRKVENRLSMSNLKTNDYFDIAINSKITKITGYEDENGECQSKETITNETSELKFNGKEYK